jgi:3-methyl-2-oxobutanoate hydroxymethyltransferase
MTDLSHGNHIAPSWNCYPSKQQQRRGLKVSALSLTSKRRRRQKITMITAYDFPSAIHVARANIDVVLVGDSVAMVELGYETTQPITVDDMIHHCKAVERGVAFANVPNPPLLVGDMPFGSYEFDNTDIALQNAYRFVKEAGMDAVKLEVQVFCSFSQLA